MIYFLYGADSFRSREKLREIVAEYSKRNVGTLDLHWIDAEEDDPKKFQAAVKSQSLFQEKRLIIIERIAKAKNFDPELKNFLKTTKGNEDVIAVFWEEKEEKEIAPLLKLLKSYGAKSQEYNILSSSELKRWLSGHAVKNNLCLDETAIDTLIRRFGGNTWQLVREAEKMALGGDSAESLSGTEEKIFGFLDYVILNNPEALKALIRLRDQGVDGFYLYSALVNHLRTLLMVAGGKSPEKVHPFVVKKAEEKLRRVDPNDILSVYERLFDEDVKTKIGMSDPYSSLINILLE